MPHENQPPKRQHLLQPIQLRHTQLKNRCVFGAHTTNMSQLGLPSAQHRAYYKERAQGGAAMIVVEPMPVHPTAVLTRGNFLNHDDAVIEPFKQLVDECKAFGTVMIQQLYHVGQHGDADLSFSPNWSPSGQPSYHDSDGSHAMSEAQIEELIQSFIDSAMRCKASGFDGVELFANYHALIEQFWTPWSNHRTDQWGGSLENRMRFGRRIMEGIRTACGTDFIIGLAISYGDAHSPDLSLEDKVAIVAHHDQARHMDYVTCGSGGYLGFDKLMPTFVFEEKVGLPLAAAVKRAVKHALVTCESHVRTPENADYIIASDEADLVSIVRGQIADPQLISKTQAQREGDIRGCISCNQMCWGRRSRDYWISCLVNPRVGREHDWHIHASNRPKNTSIVGAGPAGLECARVLAERGHQVNIYEATPDLGGQFRLAGLAPRRGQILELLGWYQSQLQALNVSIHYNSYMDADNLSHLKADEIILATGSMPDPSVSQRWLWLTDKQDLPGLDHQVYSAEDVLRKQAKLGDRLILLDEGGNWRGLGTALYLAQQGHQLTIVTPGPYVGKELTRTSADLPLRSQLKQLGAIFLVESVISQWQAGTATITSLLDQQQTQVEASAIVVATTNRAFNELELELTQAGISCHTIGDCVAPRQAIQAIYEGHKLGLEL